MKMIHKALRFLFGYYILSCEPERKASILNFLIREEVVAPLAGECSWILSRNEARRVRELINGKKLNASLSEIQGLPRLLWEKRHRVGLLIGFILAWILVIYTSGMVWRVDISGNKEVSTETVQAELEALGLAPGAKIALIDPVSLSEAYRLSHHDIAHMDVYFVGTVAHVRVIETENGEPSPSHAPSHLVASRDAVIRSFDVHHGTLKVKEGSVVRAGEVLVSGFAEGAHENMFLRAEGRVYGEVCEDITVEIPLKTSQNIVCGTETMGIKINFLGKNINFCGNSGKMIPTCGTIVKRDILTLPNGKTLPFSVMTTTAVFYETKEYRLTEREATRLAMASLNRRLRGLLADGYLITKSTTTEITGDTCILKCRVTYVTNIAEEQEILLS